MASSSTTNGDCDNRSFIDVCEKHARQAAVDFAHIYRVYVNDHGTCGHSASDFGKKFTELFLDIFEPEAKNKNINLQKAHNDAGKSFNNTAVVRNNFAVEDDSELSDPEVEASPKPNHKPFFRRLSLKGLKRGKGFFHKQHSDEVELSQSHHKQHERRSKCEKTKVTKIIVECKKEGIANYLTGENLDGTQKWEKCRLSLVKTTGGFMLEFYSPPKVWFIIVFMLRIS